MKLCLVTSAGGHLQELFSLKESWEGRDRFWITFDQVDSRTLLQGERVIWAYHPTNRNLKNLIRNLGLAWRVLRHERPDVIVSTGAGVGVPFLWMGRLFGIRTIFIELMARTRSLSLSGRLVYPIVDRYYVQWKDLASRYPKTVYSGQVL